MNDPRKQPIVALTRLHNVLPRKVTSGMLELCEIQTTGNMRPANGMQNGFVHQTTFYVHLCTMYIHRLDGAHIY